MVSIGTFSWASLRDLKQYPLTTNLVMIVTVVVVVWTHNLAYGVIAGVLLAAMFFANKIGRLLSIDSSREGETRRYEVIGQVFFASADRFTDAFDVKEPLANVVIDLSRAHFWDITAVGALDKVVLKFRSAGTQVDLVGLNKASATIVDRFGVHDKPDALDQLMGH